MTVFCHLPTTRRLPFGDECYTMMRPYCFEIYAIQLSRTLGALSTIDASLFHYIDLIQGWNDTDLARQRTC
jgi:hypothetical protein